MSYEQYLNCLKQNWEGKGSSTDAPVRSLVAHTGHLSDLGAQQAGSLPRETFNIVFLNNVPNSKLLVYLKNKRK